MRGRAVAAIALCATAGIGIVAVTWPANAATKAGYSTKALQIARQAVPASDGWASSGAGTTGGSSADDAHIAVARSRSELISALGGDNAKNGTNATPKIVFVSGRIDVSLNAAKQPLACADYADPGYSREAFLAAYDPAVWGRAAKPTGALEEARVRSARRQTDQIRINVGSNTTIIGINGARIEHANLNLANITNVIIRNIEFTDAADCFPAWDPTDGAEGNWNSLYDLVTLTGATNVWIDHNTFSDGNNHDANQPLYFGRPYQVHDGALDIIRASDLVTVSANDFYDHDKTTLIGSSDTVGADVGKLRVTVHHNRYGNVGQRAPRVRFGQVDLYNNYYVVTDEEQYTYSIGVGVQSAIYAENNFMLRSADVPVGNLVKYWKGTKLTAIGTLVKVGSQPARPVDLVAAYNLANEPDLEADAGWVPTLRTKVDQTADVPKIVNATVGIRKLGI
jgi:pectate lyase